MIFNPSSHEDSFSVAASYGLAHGLAHGSPGLPVSGPHFDGPDFDVCTGVILA